MPDRYRKSVYVFSSERIHRRILRLVQASYRHLSDGVFADNHTLCRTADFHSARSACGGNLLAANEVPRIAQMFGLDTSVRVNMMSVSHTVSMGSKAAKMIASAKK